MYAQLKQYISQRAAFSEAELGLLEELFVYREGEVARELYFVNQGCFHLFYNKDGEVTAFIFLENLADSQPAKPGNPGG